MTGLLAKLTVFAAAAPFAAGIFSPGTAVAEMYRWADRDGVIHFSDDPSAAPAGIGPLDDLPPANVMTEPRRSSVRKKSQAEPVRKAERPRDPQLEAELRGVWQSFGWALFSNDPRRAVEFIASHRRDMALETLRELRHNLPFFAMEMGGDLVLDWSEGDYAQCSFIREEEAAPGKKQKFSYPVAFVRERGVWKLAQF